MKNGKGIPFLDLITPHVELESELMEAIRGIVSTASFIGGPVLNSFEEQFAEYCGANYCVGVGSGTDALRFLLMAAGIGKGDIVLTVPNTFVATVEAILQVGAEARFVDADPETSNMSAPALQAYLERHRDEPVKAVLPVHLYGQVCDMDRITAIAEEYGLMVFEDACQAHGSKYLSRNDNSWHAAGSLATAAAFSFYPGKNLGACGEAGAVTTNDKTIAERVRMIRDHGQNKKYHHILEGFNGRLDTLQAAILSVKLPLLNDWNSKRRQAAAIYDELLARVEGVKPVGEASFSRSNYHLYVISCDYGRDELQGYLTEQGIGTGLHYPIPVHLQPAYGGLGYRNGDFPVSERLSSQLLSLPMFPHITRGDQEYVVRKIRDFFGRTASAETTAKPVDKRSYAGNNDVVLR